MTVFSFAFRHYISTIILTKCQYFGNIFTKGIRKRIKTTMKVQKKRAFRLFIFVWWGWRDFKNTEFHAFLTCFSAISTIKDGYFY